MSASSIYSGYPAANGRLKSPTNSWCPKSGFVIGSEYLEVDLGSVSRLCAVATQGLATIKEWTSSYKVQVSEDGNRWETVQENHVDQVDESLAGFDQSFIVNCLLLCIIKKFKK